MVKDYNAITHHHLSVIHQHIVASKQKEKAHGEEGPNTWSALQTAKEAVLCLLGNQEIR